MLLSVCSAVTVECCVLYPCCMGVFGMFFLVFFRRRFIEISKILYRIGENKDIREYNMIETKAGARVNIDC